MVPGQAVIRQILEFMRDLDTKEIHGYKTNFGYRVYTEKAVEMACAAVEPVVIASFPCSVRKNWSGRSSSAMRCRPALQPTTSSPRSVTRNPPASERYPGDAVEADTDLDDHW